MNAENAAMDLPLLNEEEEFDLLKGILSGDMEEFDEDGSKEENKDNAQFVGRHGRLAETGDITKQTFNFFEH